MSKRGKVGLACGVERGAFVGQFKGGGEWAFKCPAIRISGARVEWVDEVTCQVVNRCTWVEAKRPMVRRGKEEPVTERGGFCFTYTIASKKFRD